jgi:hypothetical protein
MSQRWARCVSDFRWIPSLPRRLRVVALALLLVMPTAAIGASSLSTPESLIAELASEAQSRGALGDYWDAGTQELVIVAQATGPTISAADFSGRGLTVRSETASVSSADYQFAKDSVVELVRDGKLTGASTEVSLNLQSGQIEIASTADQSVFAGVLSSLGRGVMFRAAKGDIQRFASRFNDFAPFWGGDQIYEFGAGYNQYCSSGFAVLKSGSHYMLTAGHCYQVNSNVFTGNSVAYGTVTYSIFATNGLDAELIGGQHYGGYIWRGRDSQGLSFGQVVNAYDPPVGYTDFCSSGWHSLELCGLHDTGNNILACDSNGQCSDKLARFAGDNHWLPGDSGGPIYAKGSGTTVGARAIILFAFNGSSYGQQWSGMASQWGLTICTVGNC